MYVKIICAMSWSKIIFGLRFKIWHQTFRKHDSPVSHCYNFYFHHACWSRPSQQDNRQNNVNHFMALPWANSDNQTSSLKYFSPVNIFETSSHHYSGNSNEDELHMNDSFSILCVTLKPHRYPNYQQISDIETKLLFCFYASKQQCRMESCSLILNMIMLQQHGMCFKSWDGNNICPLAEKLILKIETLQSVSNILREPLLKIVESKFA